MATPPKETMQSLKTLLSLNLKATPESEIPQLLNLHKTQLLLHINQTSPSDSPIHYRAELSTTKLLPEPTPAEVQWLAINEIPLPKHPAALHLRDYLHSAYHTDAYRVLRSASLKTYASAQQVLRFASREVQAAHEVLSYLLTNSDYEHFNNFLTENESAIRDAIVNSTNSALFLANPEKQTYRPVEPATVISLLLTSTVSKFLSLADVMSIVKAYISATSSQTQSVPLIDDPLSLHFFAASVTTAIRNDSSQIDSYVESFRPLLQDNSTLSALVCHSLAPILRLKHSDTPDGASLDQDPSRDFMKHAVLSDALGILRDLFREPMPIKHVKSMKSMFYAFSEDLLLFLSAFPPTSFEPMQVEDLSVVVTGVMAKSEATPMAKIVNSLWDDASKSPPVKGLESVLHLCSALYPLSFHPLMVLLRELSVDRRSAAHAMNYLEHRMMTMCETAEGYSDALIALDEDEDVIWDRLRDYSREHRATRAVMEVKMGNNLVFVQAMREIPGGTYRRGIPAGTVGISDETFATVTWVHQWNGLDAVLYALDTLHDILCSDAPRSPELDTVLEDLVDSATEALRFLRKVCLNGSETLGRHLRESGKLVEIIARIVVEILQMKGKASFSFEWLQTLLQNASSCLTAIVGQDVNFGKLVASILSSVVKRENLLAILSSFGEIAHCVLAAFACINSLLLEESPQTYAPVEMRDFVVYDEGVDIFKSIVSDLLCSDNLINGSLGIGLDREPSRGWLLPLWSFHLFRRKPEVLLSSSSAAALFAATILRIPSRRVLSESEALLYPAVCEAIAACASALRCRSKGFTSNRRVLESDPSASIDSKANKLTKLEETLLRPEVATAMAMLCSGGAQRLQDDTFYTSWIDSKCTYLLPLRDKTKSSKRYEVLFKDSLSVDNAAADSWLSGMATNCLSLQMYCLSRLENQQDIPQVPWPSSSSSLNTDTYVGAVVRERIASRILQGHGLDLLGLLIAVLSCRQRAAFRSLFGPCRPRMMHSGFPSCTSSKVHREDGKVKETKPSKSEKLGDPTHAVISCLRRSFEGYQELPQHHTSNGGDENFRFLKDAGHLSYKIALCVRVLRLGLESQNSRWFRDYIETDFWGLITDLVQCRGGSTESNSFDLKRTMQDWFATATMSSLCKEAYMEPHQHLVQNAEQIHDIASVWRGVAADVFRITSREILAEATEALLTNRKDESDADYCLDENLFQKPLFRWFAGVFNETWATVLLNTKHVRQGIIGPEFATRSQNLKHFKAEATIREHFRRLSSRIMEATSGSRTDSDILGKFDRSGDLAVPYGASYAYDVEELRQFLASLEVERSVSDGIVLAVMDLNMLISRQDVYVEVLASFSSMTSIILFVDSLCPTRNLALSYSSPQFGGKLCRYLPRVVTSLLSNGVLSWYTVAVAHEVSNLLSVLSSRLAKEELEQNALTLMRHGDYLELPVELQNSTPLGHLCYLISCIVSSENTETWSTEVSKLMQETTSGALLTASRYLNGSAFHSWMDLQTFVRTCIRTLGMANGTPEVWAAISTALTESITNMSDDLFLNTFTDTLHTALLSAIDAAANKFKLSDERSRGKAITALVLTLARAEIRRQNVGNTDTMISLREVNTSGVQQLLPTKGEPTTTYDLRRDERSVSHTLWCSVLQLAAVAIPGRRDLNDVEMMGSDELRYIIEFCSMHLERIIQYSLVLQCQQRGTVDGSSCQGRFQLETISLGKVEEAELGAIVLSRLSPFGLLLQNSMPDTTRDAMEQLCRYTAQASRILRSDPIERWVRPVTQYERERSGFSTEQLPASIAARSNGQSTPNPSPLQNQKVRSKLTPKRSPSQALRAAVTGKSRQGLTPSPSPNFTPLMSPAPNANETQRSMPYFSPNSPWGPHGSGLITTTGECFAVEVSMSLIRGLCAALDGIRQLSEHLGIYPFQPTMDPVGDTPGIGTLLEILKLACWELNRDNDQDRRNCLLGIADMAMHLTLSHAMMHAERGKLPQSVRDEVRKRVTTTLYRVNNLVPPIPTTSILRDDGLLALWKRF